MSQPYSEKTEIMNKPNLFKAPLLEFFVKLACIN